MNRRDIHIEGTVKSKIGNFQFQIGGDETPIDVHVETLTLEELEDYRDQIASLLATINNEIQKRR